MATTRHRPTNEASKGASRHASPKLPHERDETPGMTGGEPSERVEQGHRDVARGVQDTSRAPEADRTYRRLKGKR